jgi:hypothetical protein
MSGFSLGETVNSAADWVSSLPIVGSVFGNPVFTALLITALGAIVAMALYGDYLRQSGWKRAIRGTIYFFLIASAVMFVHHHVLTKTLRKDAAHQGVRDVFTSIQHSRETGVPVYGQGESSVPSYARPDARAHFAAPESFDSKQLPAPRAARADNVGIGDLDIEDVVVSVPSR